MSLPTISVWSGKRIEIAGGPGFLLVKPLTFMNKSGESAAAILRFYQLLPRTILGTKKDSDLSSALTVVHDELDLPFGTLKRSVNSRPAGHNGIKSLIDHLKTQNFVRLRIGIHTENRRQLPTEAFVLQPFSSEEQKSLPDIIKKAIKELQASL
jgi:PTH1 family peptidyl-tRNA hydrolase